MELEPTLHNPPTSHSMAEFKDDFQVGPETITLFDKYLGITDANQLRNHILAISEKLKTVSIPCSEKFMCDSSGNIGEKLNIAAKRHVFLNYFSE
jgi:hypothetical protein